MAAAAYYPGAVTPIEPLIELFRAVDGLAERVELDWWGAVVTDSRFPKIWDMNYARVDGARPDLTLAEVEASLLPALRGAGAMHEHVVLFGPEGTEGLLRELEARGDRISWDTVMEALEPGAPRGGLPPVEEVLEPDEAFWALQGESMRESDVTEPDAVRELIAWERDLLVPFGKRWFTVRLGRDMVGFGALLVRDGVGYVDNMLTLPRARRRGIASAIVIRMREEAARVGAGRVFLLADRPDPIRLYERLGFRRIGEIASSLRRL